MHTVHGTSFTDSPPHHQNIGLLRDAWWLLAEEALAIMARGEDPLEVKAQDTPVDKLLILARHASPCAMQAESGKTTAKSHPTGKEPASVYSLLDGITERLWKAAFKHGFRLDSDRLRDFVACVHLWGCGYRTPADYVEAKKLKKRAVEELHRFMAGVPGRSSLSVPPTRALAAPIEETDGEPRLQGEPENETKRDTPESATSLGLAPSTEPPPATQSDVGYTIWCRLHIDPSTKTIRLDDKTATFKRARAFEIFTYIAIAEGNFVTSEDIKTNVRACKGRIDKILADGLPPWVRQLIPSQSGHGGGYHLVLPEKQVRKGAR